jgi:hypothetical protein
MNKIFNPNNIFAFPLKAYDLQNVFFCKELLKERFFCVFGDFENLSSSRYILQEAYSVVCEDDIMNSINQINKRIYNSVLFSFLYKARGELEALSFDDFKEKFLTEEEIKKEFINFGISFDKDDFSDGDFSDKAVKFMQVAEDFYKPENLSKFTDFCTDTSDIYALCKKQNIRAYDYASIITMAIIGFEECYIEQKKYEKIVNVYGEKIVEEFGGWCEFIASFMLGELFNYKFANKDEEEDDEEENEIKNNFMLVYNALTLPHDIFTMSEIWKNGVEGVKEQLISILEKYLDQDEIDEQKEFYEKKVKYYKRECAKLKLDIQDFAQILNIFYDDFCAPFKDLDNDFLLEEMAKGIVTPFTTLKGDETLYQGSSNNLLSEIAYALVSYFTDAKRNSTYSLFEATDNFLHRHKLSLRRNEIPIELPLIILKNALITTKAVYLQNGFLFSKKIKRIAWGDVQFSAKILTIEDVQFSFSNDDEFVLLLNLSDLLIDDRNEVAEIKEEFHAKIEAFKLSFDNLKKRFS